ncbi:MAG: hypothetical protein AB7F35_28130 [Acetobacteraceae bacterium]
MTVTRIPGRNALAAARTSSEPATAPANFFSAAELGMFRDETSCVAAGIAEDAMFQKPSLHKPACGAIPAMPSEICSEDAMKRGCGGKIRHMRNDTLRSNAI